MTSSSARRRPYVQVPNDLVDVMADAGLDAAAIGLNLAAWAESSRDALDGRIVTRRLHRLIGWTAQRERDLVAAGFWTAASDGIRIAEYLVFNRTRAAIEDIAAKRADAGSKGGRARVERAGRGPDDDPTTGERLPSADRALTERSPHAASPFGAPGTGNARQTASKLLTRASTATTTETEKVPIGESEDARASSPQRSRSGPNGAETASPFRLSRESRSRDTSDEWAALPRRWEPFRLAMAERGLVRPPTPAQAERLWPIVDARPDDAATWVCEAPGGAKMAAIVGYVFDRWHELEATVEPDPAPAPRTGPRAELARLAADPEPTDLEERRDSRRRSAIDGFAAGDVPWEVAIRHASAEDLRAAQREAVR